jgi:hypothetical protein
MGSFPIHILMRVHFYFNYIRDVLFLPHHYMHWRGHPKSLKDSYDDQLDEFTTTLVHGII